MSLDRTDGLPRPQRRFLRIVVLASLCLLLAVVSPIAWYLYRPLTDVEQRLVGTWRATTTSTPVVLTFHSNRTITSPRHPPGRWSIHGNRLYETDTVIVEFVRTLLRNRIDDSMQVDFIDDDNISINGGAQQWQRVSAE